MSYGLHFSHSRTNLSFCLFNFGGQKFYVWTPFTEKIGAKSLKMTKMEFIGPNWHQMYVFRYKLAFLYIQTKKYVIRLKATI